MLKLISNQGRLATILAAYFLLGSFKKKSRLKMSLKMAG
jgi:hypothetical protein